MFNLGENSKVRGSGHLILNALRAFTIIGLVVVMAASWAMIILSGLTGNFSFFDTASHFFVFGIAVFLVISELGLLKKYYEKNWPVLSQSHSLAWLGFALVIMGCQVMGDLIKPAYTIDNLGLAMWRLVMAAGILSITHGVFNLVASVIFRDGTNGITARHIRADGNLAAPVNKGSFYDDYPQAYSHRDNYSQGGSSVHAKEEEVSAARRFTRMLNPKNLPNFRDFRKSKMQISAPIVHPSHDSDLESGDDRLSDRQSPIMPAVQRPPTALHPAYTGVSTSSRYSSAHMDRF
ncbi:hypothetical protein B0T19DRAFT_256601 [Cercophora scortea]|uniref:DUF7598 domain-containing protein n=1 Tax=Cercophora scortea TaxID=314031 RepID=A0AAE0I9Y3_9PEZI|nr:hypothetical protein B0T19DRAFT_256601 [Cercophora scortea]